MLHLSVDDVRFFPLFLSSFAFCIYHLWSRHDIAWLL